MGKPNPVTIPKEARINSLREVSLGFTKKIVQDEARRCPQCAQATCMPACPLGIDIPGFIRFLREADSTAALERITQANPFPEICGRLCPAPCESACVFYADGQPIAIRQLERYAADEGVLKEKPILPSAGAKKVAIIGSGLSGLTAAYYLARARLDVNIFEATHEPGGLLRFCVPAFRLPAAVLKGTIAKVKSVGVQIHTDMVFGSTLTMDELSMRGFDAVLLATGASLPVFSDLPGHHFSHVYYDVEFLNEHQSIDKEQALWCEGKKRNFASQAVVLGKGPAAFDVARLCLRLGSEVNLVFEGLEEQLDISTEILEESLKEGLRIHSMQAVEIVGDAQGMVSGVKCRPLKIIEGQKDITVEVSQQESVILEAQAVIIANGHRPSALDERIGQRPTPKVFTCHYTKKADWSVVEAIASGKAAAQEIIAYLA